MAAARMHRENLPKTLDKALSAANIDLKDVNAVGFAVGPGLAPCLRAGLEFTSELCSRMDAATPIVAVHHMEAHALSPRLCDPDLAFPYLVLLASGGHCLLILAEGVGQYRRLGSCSDDAPGEAFDKIARALDIDGGGGALEQLASTGDPAAFPFQLPLTRERSCRFSFSGLKSQAMRHIRQQRATRAAAWQAHLAAGFQRAVVDHIVKRLQRALLYCCEHLKLPLTSVVVAGGVGCNQTLRKTVTELSAAFGVATAYPPPSLCVDNGLMIAWAAYEHLRGPAHCVPAAEVALADGMPDVPHSLVMPVSLLPQLRFIPKWPLGTDEANSVLAADIKTPKLSLSC